MSNYPEDFVQIDADDQEIDSVAVQLFEKLGAPGGLPAWPGEQIQRQYTADKGLHLMVTTVRFVDVLSRAGAFDRPGWRGLDYGCGWGRIASVILCRGGPDQLDLCDAWPTTMEILRAAGFANRKFKVSEILAEGELKRSRYDFIYAYSIFTHLRRDVYDNNLHRLIQALRPGGMLFLTVRHEGFLRRAKLKAGPDALATLAERRFWFKTNRQRPRFGHSVIARSYLADLSVASSTEYLGQVEPHQHIYKLIR